MTQYPPQFKTAASNALKCLVFWTNSGKPQFCRTRPNKYIGESVLVIHKHFHQPMRCQFENFCLYRSQCSRWSIIVQMQRRHFTHWNLWSTPVHIFFHKCLIIFARLLQKYQSTHWFPIFFPPPNQHQP